MAGKRIARMYGWPATGLHECMHGRLYRHTRMYNVHIYYNMCCMAGNRPARMLQRMYTYSIIIYICSDFRSKKVVRTCKPLAMHQLEDDPDFRRALNKRLRVLREHVLQELKQRHRARMTAFCVLMCVRSCLPASSIKGKTGHSRDLPQSKMAGPEPTQRHQGPTRPCRHRPEG